VFVTSKFFQASLIMVNMATQTVSSYFEIIRHARLQLSSDTIRFIFSLIVGDRERKF